MSGLLTIDRGSAPAWIVDAILRGGFRFALGPTLLGEYRTVLLRPRIRDLHDLSTSEVEAILVDVVALAFWREPAMSLELAPDAGDEHPWDLLACLDGAILVTGDGQLQRQPPSFASVTIPRSFVALLVGETVEP